MTEAEYQSRIQELEQKVLELDQERLHVLSRVETVEQQNRELSVKVMQAFNSDPGDYWHGPCAHGRDPADLCDLCSGLIDDGRQLAVIVEAGSCLTCGRYNGKGPFYCDCDCQCGRGHEL